jgi:hypothetical protein
MKPPKDLAKAREVGLEVDSEEEELEGESQAYFINAMNKVTWP